MSLINLNHVKIDKLEINEDDNFLYLIINKDNLKLFSGAPAPPPPKGGKKSETNRKKHSKEGKSTRRRR